MRRFGEKTRRHYFTVRLPEILCKGSADNCSAYMDVSNDNGNLVIENWAVIFEGIAIQPDWVSQEIINHELSSVCFK